LKRSIDDVAMPVAQTKYTVFIAFPLRQIHNRLNLYPL